MMQHRTWLSMLALTTAMPVAAREMSPQEVRKLSSTPPTLVEHYGPAALQIGELRVPVGKGPFPVAIVIHGGCWTKGFDTVRGTAPMASSLTAKGIATWNLEYREIGDPGGAWPGTFADWATGTDRLRTLAKKYRLNLKRVIVVGHSAGALAALWVAARPRLDKASVVRGSTPLQVRAAVAIDGPGDLAPFIGVDKFICGQPVVAQLMGGLPTDVPDRYRDGSPFAHLPLGVPQTLVSSMVLTAKDAEKYRAAAATQGDTVVVVTTPGSDHFNIIAPGEPQYADVEAAILKAVPKK